MDIKKALVVDDEEALRDIIVEVLSMQDIDTIQAANGIEALKLAKEHKDEIDLLIMDMYMPMMSGEETFKQISKFMPDCTVIFMSGYNNDQSFSDSEMGSQCRFLKKPFTISGLREMIFDVSESTS